ncbi:NAD(P)H-dependent oxidoreductase [Flavobacterium marginilacus]|uniref:NAD(P)H-dependent oxidoreductase n=1 Tax=Flavobacterium marginilacus TaxID=3003256 RepID=UPI00248DA08A|nr:NAD(P)H-dependent oxidoreductase [Flavobacterium marginilacus]
MNKTQTVLLINTHLTYPTFSEGLLNASFHQKAKDFFENANFKVLETKVEEAYNIDEEVEKHLQADIIILQTPINWFGAPWIYKKYVDEVFSSAGTSKKFLEDDGRSRKDLTRQYGTGGYLQGKKFMVSATWNAPKESFEDPNQILFQGRSTADFFIPITSNYRFCGVDIVADYNCFDIYKGGDIVRDLENYPSHLKKVFGI